MRPTNKNKWMTSYNPGLTTRCENLTRSIFVTNDASELLQKEDRYDSFSYFILLPNKQQEQPAFEYFVSRPHKIFDHRYKHG